VSGGDSRHVGGSGYPASCFFTEPRSHTHSCADRQKICTFGRSSLRCRAVPVRMPKNVDPGSAPVEQMCVPQLGQNTIAFTCPLYPRKRTLAGLPLSIRLGTTFATGLSSKPVKVVRLASQPTKPALREEPRRKEPRLTFFLKG